MFSDFNFQLLNDPEFKEDSVREEILFPILKRLGYTASGKCGIIRSKLLVHPFVMIGSQSKKINIIPDYILTFDGDYIAVIDAKSPTQDIIKSYHVEQVYSYGIHPEVRVNRYALCNGKKIVVYDIDKFEPILDLNIVEIDKKWEEVEKVLRADYIIFPEKKDFVPDLGLRMLKSGLKTDVPLHFITFDIFEITKVRDDLYTSFSKMDTDDGGFGLSMDYSPQQLEQILSMLPQQYAEKIKNLLSRAPFKVILNFPINLVLEAKLGKLQKGLYEQFVPFEAVNIDIEASKEIFCDTLSTMENLIIEEN
ncbi:MAG: hypothetical protein WC600_11455 [Desulfobaccales bacterium]